MVWTTLLCVFFWRLFKCWLVHMASKCSHVLLWEARHRGPLGDMLCFNMVFFMKSSMYWP